MLLVIFVMLGIPGFVDQIVSISDTARQSLNLDKKVTDTDIDILSTSIFQGTDTIVFHVENVGTEKLWQYDKFSLLVTYDANITNTKTKITETLTFTNDVVVGHSPIIVDNITPYTSNCSFCGFSHTVGASGSNQILIIGVTLTGSKTVSSASYGGQSFLPIRSDDDGGNYHTELWYLLDPPTGSNFLTVLTSASGDVAIGAISLNGISQTSPIDTHAGNTGTSEFPSITLTTNVDDAWILDNLGTRNGPLTPDVDTQTERWDLLIGTTTGGGSTNATNIAGPHTMSWTNEDGPNDYALSAVSLRPANTHPLKWSINSITDDLQEPNILNPGETAEIAGKLTYLLADGGTATVVLSTNNGVTATESVIGS